MRALAWLAARPVRTAASLYALLAVLLFAPALMPGRTLNSADALWSDTPWKPLKPGDVRAYGANPELADQTVVFLPFLEYARERLPDIPLWNPHIMAGRPFLANSQSALFSPFSLPAYVLPFWRSFAVIAVLKVFLAAFGTFLLARALAMRFAGAFLAGIVFGFGLFFVSWLGWPLTSVWAWLPWLLLLTDRLVRRPDTFAVAGLAAVTALGFFGGHPESSFHSLFATLAFFVLRLWQLRRGEHAAQPWWHAPAAFVGALLIGAMLAAVTLIPFAELLALSADTAERGVAAAVKVPTKFLVGLVMYGWYGRPTEVSLGGLVGEYGFFVGALTLTLVAAALVLRPDRGRVAVAAFGAFSLAMVFGVEPLFSIVRELPGFGIVHNTRLTVVFVLCAALLAGWGLDDLTTRAAASPRARWLPPIAGLLLALPVAYVFLRGRTELGALGDGLALAWGFDWPERGPEAADVIRAGALILWVTFAGVALALVWARRSGRLADALFAGLAIALVCADLFRAGMGLNPAIPVANAEQPATGAIRYLQQRAPARFAGASPVKVALAPFSPDTAMRFGGYDARGYDYPIERRFDRLWRTTVEPVTPLTVHTVRAQVNERSLRTLGLLGVESVIQQPQDPPLDVPGLRLVYDRPDARIYRNPEGMPRAWLVGSQQVVGSEDAAFAAITASGFDPGRTAVTERRIEGLAEGSSGSSPGSVSVTGIDPERVALRADASRPALLVLSDIHYPGWRATVDGRGADIERVDYLLRGIRVPAGESEVVLTYRPLSFRIGWIVSLVTMLGLLGALIVAWRRRRTA
jgi:hypothetical protein